MGKFTPQKYTHLWNDLPQDERCRLMPYQIENHILQLEQTRQVIECNHKRTIRDISDHIKNLKSSLAKLESG